MRELHQANVERSAATQRQLDALIREVNALPEDAQVLCNALASANLPSATDAGTAGAPEAGSEVTEATPEPPSSVLPKFGAPPTPEHSNRLDDCREPATLPLTGSPSGSEHITTSPQRRPFASLMCLLRSGRPTDRALGQTRPVARRDPPEHGPTDRLRTPPPAGPVDALARLRTPPCPLPPDPNAVDAASRGGFARLVGDTPYLGASGPMSNASGTTLPGDPALPETTLEEGEERNNDLRQENPLLIAAIRLRRAHLLSVRDIVERQGRVQMRLAISACERPTCGPDFATNATTSNLPSGLAPGRDAERTPDQAHRAGQRDAQSRLAAPERHPNDPDDPCASFTKDSLPDERA